MTDTAHPELKVHTCAVYRIRLNGVISEEWRMQLEDMQMTSYLPTGVSGTPETMLVGKVRDQAALSGILNLLHALGLPIIDVICLGQALAKDTLPGGHD